MGTEPASDYTAYDDAGDGSRHALLKDDNERRTFEIEQRSGGQIKLEHAFDAVRAVTYLKHVLLDLGVLDRADFDFEGQRSALLDKVEEELTAFKAAKETALAHARLTGDPNGAAGPRIIHP